MKSTLHPIIFFGTEDFSAVALTGLITAGFPVVAVVTKPDSRKGRGQKLTPPQVKTIAFENNIPVWQPNKLKDISDSIRALQPVAGVLVSYGKILPQTTLDLFTPGIINLHPSLLPQYRGPSPIESAIANGDPETGVTVMQLSAAMDAGPIYGAQIVPLNGTEAQSELYGILADIGSDLLVKLLPTITSGELQPTAQDDATATYCALLEKENAFVDPSAFTASELEQHIRAYREFPKTKLRIDNHVVIISKAHIVAQKKTPLDIECRDGKYISIDELIAPSGKLMTASAFLNGYAAA